MPTYKYEAAYASGERVNGVVEALSQTEAVAQIRQSCEVVLSLSEVRAAVRDPFERFHKIDAKSLSLACRQFAIVLKAGLPLVQTVDLVAGQVSDKALAKLLRQASEDVAGGWSLSYSFGQRGAALPVTFREAIRAGEESGDLAGAFARMSSYYERMYKTRAKVSGAMLYPAFVLAVAAVVVGVIMVFAVPTFANTFESMNLELPLVTRVLIGVSNFITRYGWVLLALICLLGFGLRLYAQSPRGGRAVARFKLSLPVLGSINEMAAASQFAHTMATMLAAGMPILQALDIAGRAVSNAELQNQILDTLPGVEAGRPLGECMAAQNLLPDMLVQMTAVGETTGSMEATLEVLAEYYDNEVETRSARAISLLEPAIICVLAVLVVGILLAVYLPLFAMESGIG